MTFEGFLIYFLVSLVAFLLGKIVVGLHERYHMYKVKKALASLIESGALDEFMEQLIVLSEEEEQD